MIVKYKGRDEVNTNPAGDWKSNIIALEECSSLNDLFSFLLVHSYLADYRLNMRYCRKSDW